MGDHFSPLEALFTLLVTRFCIQIVCSKGTAATPFEIQNRASLSFPFLDPEFWTESWFLEMKSILATFFHAHKDQEA
jgi:hypothetical protein